MRQEEKSSKIQQICTLFKIQIKNSISKLLHSSGTNKKTKYFAIDLQMIYLQMIYPIRGLIPKYIKNFQNSIPTYHGNANHNHDELSRYTYQSG